MLKLKLTFFFVLISFVSFLQNSTLSGSIKDSETGELLIGASVFVEELKQGISSNLYGFYSLTIPNGNYTVKVSFVGYREVVKKIEINESQKLNIELVPTDVFIPIVTIEGENEDGNTRDTDMSKVELDVEQLKTLPAFMGEVDILKSIQLLPGVQSSGEGNTGFYVRGGGPDQNLIMLDEAVVYNAAHLFGFFSVFNADAIKNVNLVKGGMPANYGGRLSSVLDISMKDGNAKKFQADGGIGVIASRLTLQGPIQKNKSSFIVSGRRTYISELAQPFIKDDSPVKGSGYYFYDFNAKLNYEISDKDRLYLSGYFGKDVFTYVQAESGFTVNIPWGNATAALRWNHLFSDKLFLNTTAIYSSYDFQFEGRQEDFSFGLYSGIRDWNLKADFSYYPNPKHTIKFGANYTYHTFIPNNVTATQGDTEFDLGGAVRLYANDGALYFLDDVELTSLLKMNIGFRLSSFQHIGPFTRYIKDNNDNIIETIEYTGKKALKTYVRPEPRVTGRLILDENSSFKFGSTLNYQYMHLVSVGGNSLPTDLWIPSTDVIKPQQAIQFNMGYFRNFKNNMFETSVEVYYKDLQNLIEFKDAADPSDGVNDNIDNQVTFGDGYSYGAELFIKKNKGKLTGWIGYTWSKTFRQFDELNNGNKYPAKFDRRHDLSITGAYRLNERWVFGAVFVYATGNSITLPASKYFVEGELLVEYADRNSYRMAPYHRADISATWYGKKYKEFKNIETGEMEQVPKKFTSNWNFSVFNLYNRKNPYFIYFDNTGNLTQGTLDVAAIQVSLFPVLPSVTWNFSF
ncbi:TonB-dependent receptor [Flavobacteriales bacterium]|nr:TonB-dependent receptor [Flavobacteriales bacterium]